MSKKFAVFLGCIISLPTFAHPDYKAMKSLAEEWKPPAHILLGMHEGYSFMQGAYQHDGQTPFHRIDLGAKVTAFHQVDIAAELGVQSGNDLRLSASSALINAAGGLPLQATLKPTLDALVGLSAKISLNLPIYGVLKGGVAYRQLSLQSRTSQRDSIRKIDGEVQAGLAIHISKHAIFSMLYQGIYGGNDSGARLSSTNDVTLKHIPTQNALMAGLTYKL